MGHVLVGTPKEMVALKNKRSIDFRHIKMCILDDADTVFTSNLVKNEIVHQLNDTCKKVLISSATVHLSMDLMIPYDVHVDIVQPNAIHCFAICSTVFDKVKAILAAYDEIKRFKVQGIIFCQVIFILFFEITYYRQIHSRNSIFRFTHMKFSFFFID